MKMRMSQLSRGSFVKGADTVLFLVLSIFIVGSVLFGYRVFSIPTSHYAFISCEENCEKIVGESMEQAHHLWKLFKQKPYGWSDEWLDGPALQAWKGDTRFEAIMAPHQFGSSALQPFVIKTVSIVRTAFYNPLYLLSGFVNLPFHFVFSLFLCLLMVATAFMAANIVGGYGRGFFLAVLMIPFLFTHGRIVVLNFSVVLLLYLFYLPAEEKNKPHNILLPLLCLVCSSLATSIFFVIYIFYLAQVILQWHGLKVANRAMGILIITAFFPFFISTVLKNLFVYDNNLAILITEHGSLFQWNSSRLILHNIVGLSLLYPLPFLALIPRFSKLYFHYYIHALCLCLALMGMIFGTNFTQLLLIANSVVLKRFLLDGYLFNTERSSRFLSEDRTERGREG